MNQDARKPLILIADDDPTVRLLGTEVLSAAGFTTIAADNGTDAITDFGKYQPDAVLLDIDMPGADGFAICEHIRASQRPDVPVIMLTGRDDFSAVRRAYEIGATDFFTKPVHWPALPYKLNYVLRNALLREELANTQRRRDALLEALPDRIVLLNEKGVVVERVNEGSESRTDGSTIESAQSLEDLLPLSVAQVAREHLHAAVSSNETQSFEYQLDGGKRSFEVRVVPQAEDIVIMIFRDVTQRHRSEAKIRHLAYYDSITGLPNRQYFARELRRAMRHTKRTGKLLAVLYIDLDRFKRINDTLGHSVGDALLKAVASRLEGSIRPQDCLATGVTEEIGSAAGQDGSPIQLARLGGDEFVVMLSDLDVREQAGAVAGRIRQTLSAPFSYEGHQFVVTPSIGGAIYPDDGTDLETLLMHADTAMYQSKSAGRNTFRYFEKSMTESALDRLSMEQDLRQALDAGQFLLFYQPKHDLKSGDLLGVEALLRWNHPERGWIPPTSFIPLAEETGLIVPIGEWLLDEACRQLREWHNGGDNDLTMAVNISPEQVSRSDLPKNVLEAIWKHGIRPQCLELEITENLLMQDVEKSKDTMFRLKDAGVRLAIDDFGTGYSSLSYLRKFPIDTLKIDRAFVMDLHKNSDDNAICSAIIAVGRKLGLFVVAEGIEIEEQRQSLEANNCDCGQGYLFSRPLPADEFERYREDCLGRKFSRTLSG